LVATNRQNQDFAPITNPFYRLIPIRIICLSDECLKSTYELETSKTRRPKVRLRRGKQTAMLLYIEASPRKDRSASIEVSRAFLEAYRAANPHDEIETLDIWASDLPSFNGEALAAKYAGLNGTPLTTDHGAENRLG
jgi:hypothetical protein